MSGFSSETPFLNLGWDMGYPDLGLRYLLGYLQTTTKIVPRGKTQPSGFLWQGTAA